ncbi:MAG: 5-(carboxyamino)imidazole ribonucleotide synthase [Planctomycetota bacterium]
MSGTHDANHRTLEPGATLGMLGGGQLGRMFAEAATTLGYDTHVLCPEADGPASQVAAKHTVAAYDDLEAVERWAASVAAVTYEFENVPAATAAACNKHAPVRPGQQVLAVAQDRTIEKRTLRDFGLPVTPFEPVNSFAGLDQAANQLGLPAVLKTARGGYDGKGQRVIHGPNELTYAWEELGSGKVPCILEAMIDFEQEISVVAARSVAGEIKTYGPIANSHRNHILDVSVVPSGAAREVDERAVNVTRDVMEKLDVVGVLCVEFFQVRGGTASFETYGPVLINEIAPRPHNSGHLTIEAHASSQFEQQVRAVCGLALGDATLLKPAAMVNVLGELWGPDGQAPTWRTIEGRDQLALHLYGKTVARPGRKMGHLTATARTAHEALRDAVEARAAVAWRGEGLGPD